MAEIWSITVIVGPIILIAAIVYAWLRNRNARKATKRKADRGAERLQEKVERDQTPV
jgi:FtsZ-interacting cell division protein ZipA